MADLNWTPRRFFFKGTMVGIGLWRLASKGCCATLLEAGLAFASIVPSEWPEWEFTLFWGTSHQGASLRSEVILSQGFDLHSNSM
jgi:hypothetical protein